MALRMPLRRCCGCTPTQVRPLTGNVAPGTGNRENGYEECMAASSLTVGTAPSSGTASASWCSLTTPTVRDHVRGSGRST